ncbi:Thioredoxin-like protein 1 [Teratosphaeriaceae sp. CCFEE 6253]|nr:Thioredoxin-like protein 1 [Teratosphaeriaceae sp. CCFEE 6253]
MSSSSSSATAPAGPTVTINSPQHFTQLLASSRIVVTDFWAAWCGPCKAIAPLYAQLATQLSRSGSLTFTKVDTEAQKDIVRTYNVTALPTFIIFKAGREVKRIRGADVKGLNEAVKTLAAEAGKADEEGAAAGGSSSAGSVGEDGVWMGAPAPKNYPEVTSAVDLKGLDFLNLDSEAGGARAVFDTAKPSSLRKVAAKEGRPDWIVSDTDEQLMLFIPFQATIKLHSLHLTSLPPADDSDVSRPKTLRLYTNTPHVVGFDEADDTPCAQTITLSPSDWDAATGTAKVELRFVKFQNISSLVIFVVDGESGEAETTRVDRVRLFGETGEKRAMGKLEKVGDEQGE